MSAVDLYCATANPGKQREFQQAAGNDFVVHRLDPRDCPEEGHSFQENAVSKALCYSRAFHPKDASGNEGLVFADDSGLVVHPLDGAPGIYSARFAGPGADDQANNRLLIEKLAGVPESQRSGRFVCCIALVRGERVLGTFEESAQGRILDSPAGEGGFGYDPLFFYPPLGVTFAEVAAEIKWRHSHRGKAFRAMLETLKREPTTSPLQPSPAAKRRQE